MQTPRDTEHLFVQREQWFFDTRNSFYWDPASLEAQIFPLYDDQNPTITAEKITDWLNQLRIAYWDDWLRKFLYVVAAHDEWLSNARKSWILWLWHFMLHNVHVPSGFILLAMNFANRSGKQDAITQWSEWLKRHFNIPHLEVLLNVLWKDAVQSGMMTQWELYIIRQQLIIPIVCAQLPLDLETSSWLIH